MLGNRSLCLISICALALGFEALNADKISFYEARIVASTQAAIMTRRSQGVHVTSLPYSVSQETSLPLYSTDGNLLAYVFELEPEGFVVVTTDGDLVPVIAYSEQGYFSWEEENPLLDVLRGDLGKQWDALQQGTYPIQKIEKNHESWDAFVTGKAALRDPGDSWPPAGQTESGGWVSSAWTQSSPYNDSCPVDPVTEVHCLAGCPAVAVGQIVNFWQYPDSVIFSPDDSYTSSYKGRVIPIDAPAASIPWIDYNQGNPPDGVCADLVYACGVATQSVYTSEVSGVFTNSWCAHAFLEHLDYTSADFREGDSGDFYEILEQNMKDSMPAIIVIVGEIGGHTLVCDGYREPQSGGDPQYHLNFGWGTYQPRYLPLCWYAIPDSLPLGLTTLHEAIVNIEAPRRPAKVAITQKEPEQGYVTISCPGVFSRPALINYTLPRSGHVKLEVWDASGRRVSLLVNAIQSEGDHRIEWNCIDKQASPFPCGIYFIRLQTDSTVVCQKAVRIR